MLRLCFGTILWHRGPKELYEKELNRFLLTNLVLFRDLVVFIGNHKSFEMPVYLQVFAIHGRACFLSPANSGGKQCSNS